jgi:hypothetical protein
MAVRPTLASTASVIADGDFVDRGSANGRQVEGGDHRPRERLRVQTPDQLIKVDTRRDRNGDLRRDVQGEIGCRRLANLQSVSAALAPRGHVRS